MTVLFPQTYTNMKNVTAIQNRHSEEQYTNKSNQEKQTKTRIQKRLDINEYYF